MVFSRFGSGRQSSQLQAQKATLGSGTGASECAVGTGMPHGVFPFRKQPPKPSAAGSESDVRQWHRGFGSAVGTGMPWCLPVSEAAAKAVSCRLRKRR